MSASGSPSVHSSQSSTASTVPCSSMMQFPSRKSPCTTVLSRCSGMRAREELVDLLDPGKVVRLRLLVLAVPTAELATDVVVLLREIAESDGVDVDRVQCHVRVHDALARVSPRRLVERVQCGADVVEHDALDVLHHVERCAGHGLVDAVPQRFGYRHVGGAERVDDAVLAADVVGGGEHHVERRATDDAVASVGVGEAHGDVGAAADDLLGGEGRYELWHVLHEPRGQPVEIDAGRRVGGHRLPTSR